MTDIAGQQAPTFPMQRRCPYGPPPKCEQSSEQAPVASVLLPTARLGVAPSWMR